MPVVVFIAEERFVLDGDADIERLRSEVVAAARAGGDLLHLPHRGGSSDVLVTPSIAVRIDYLPTRRTEDEEVDRDLVLDFDQYE